MEFIQGVWEFIQPYLSAGGIVGLIAIVLGLVAAKTGLDFLVDIREAIESYQQAKHPDSPGGQRVTDAERAAIEKEFSEAMEKIWSKYRDTLFSFLGTVWKKITFWK